MGQNHATCLTCTTIVPVNNSGVETPHYPERRPTSLPIAHPYSLGEQERVSLELIFDKLVKSLEAEAKAICQSSKTELEGKDFQRYRTHDRYVVFRYDDGNPEKLRIGFKVDFTLFKKVGEGLHKTATITIYTHWRRQLQPIMDSFRKSAKKLEINCQWSLKAPQKRPLKIIPSEST